MCARHVLVHERLFNRVRDFDYERLMFVMVKTFVIWAFHAVNFACFLLRPPLPV